MIRTRLQTVVLGLGLGLGLVGSRAGYADDMLIFTLPGCRPCAKLAALLAEHPELLKDFTVSHVDVAEQPETASLFAVKTAPTLVWLDAQDKERARLIGAPTKRQLERWLADPKPVP